MKSTVTWLLPVKNGMPFLTETLASIKAQTYRDWQILAWDNGSTDGSIQELNRWIPGELPGEVIIGQPLGLGACLAKMTVLADSEFCARIDADDVNFPTRLEEQLKFLRNHPEVVAVGTQVIKIDEFGREYGQHYQLPIAHDDIVHRMLHSWVMWHPTVLFRRNAIINVGNYINYEPVLIEDYDLWMRLAENNRLANMEQCLVKYRVTDSSATMQALKMGTLNGAIASCFVLNAPRLFGCSEDQANDLRNGARRFALPLLYQVVRHICRVQGSTIFERFRSESFRRAVAQIVPPHDVLTHLYFAFFAPSFGKSLLEIRSTLSKGWCHYSKAVLRRLSFLKML